MKVAISHPGKAKQRSFLAKAGLENLLDLVPVAVYCCDTEGNIVYFNQKAVELWGRRPNKGETVEKFCGSYKIYNLDGSYLPHDKCPMAQAILEQHPALNGDIIVERPDGSWIYVKANISALYDQEGKTLGAVNTLKDVSPEWQLSQDYKTILENFRFLADFIPQLVWMANAQGVFDYYNQNWLRYAGISMEELKTESWFHLIHPEEKEATLAAWQEALQATGDFKQLLRLKNGENAQYHWFLVRAIPLRNEKGSVIRWFGTCTDVHDQKLGEMELKKNNEKLEYANHELTKINNQLDTFIYTASHDLKAPISNIEGLTTNLARSINKDFVDKAQLNYAIELIFSSINKFKTTISNLTEIAKIQKNLDNAADFEHISLADLVKEITDDIEPIIRKNQALVHLHCEDCPSVYFSKSNLKSVLYNLVSNAIKYRDPQRIPVVHIKTERRGEEIVLSIADNGLGLKESAKDKLFGLFKRFHNHVEGSGMGLYIVKKIVDNANGRIEVETKEGQGTTFQIFLKD